MKDKIYFEREFDNPIDEINHKIDNEKRKIGNMRNLSIAIMIALAIFLISTISYNLYNYYQDGQIKKAGEEFCSQGGFVFNEDSCIEKLADGKARIHELVYYEDEWLFVENANKP